MGTTVDTIGVDIVARIDKLEAGLRQAEAKVGASADRMADNAKKKAGFFSKTAFQKHFVQGLATAFLLDRGFKALNDGFDALDANLARARSGAISYGDAWIKTIDEIVHKLPVLGQAISLGEKIGRSIFGASDSFAPPKTDAEVMTESVHSKAVKAHIDALGGAKTKAGIEAIYQAALDALAKEISDATEAVMKTDSLGNPLFSPAEKQRVLAENNAYQADAAKALDDQRKEQLKALHKSIPAFTSFSTAVGTYKAANMPREAEHAAKDTAKNTKKMASALDKLLNKGGMIVAFA